MIKIFLILVYFTGDGPVAFPLHEFPPEQAKVCMAQKDTINALLGPYGVIAICSEKHEEHTKGEQGS